MHQYTGGTSVPPLFLLNILIRVENVRRGNHRKTLGAGPPGPGAGLRPLFQFPGGRGGTDCGRPDLHRLQHRKRLLRRLHVRRASSALYRRGRGPTADHSFGRHRRYAAAGGALRPLPPGALRVQPGLPGHHGQPARELSGLDPGPAPPRCL